MNTVILVGRLTANPEIVEIQTAAFVQTYACAIFHGGVIRSRRTNVPDPHHAATVDVDPAIGVVAAEGVHYILPHASRIEGGVCDSE